MTLLRRLARALLALQLARPWLVIGIAIVSAAVSAGFASRLPLKTGLGELLPEGRESVRIADRVNERLASASTLTIVAEGNDVHALEAFVEALAPEIRRLGPALVGNVDAGVRPAREFFAAHALLYAPLADVRRAHDEVLARFGDEVARAEGGFVDDAKADKPLADEIRSRVTAPTPPGADRYPDGYYLDAKGSPKKIALLIRTPVSSGDTDASTRLRAQVDAVIARVDPKRFDPAMQLGFTGDLVTSAEEVRAVKADLAHVGAVGIAMVLGVVFLFYLRARALAALGVTIAVGVLWSFAFAAAAVDHLNASTALLVSILVGNGINFGIVYIARYFEARRESDLAASIATAGATTWAATLTAALAALTAYGSLALTEFRGFRQFGLLGGAGMLLCWLASYVVLPAVLVALERIAPLGPPSALHLRLAASYGKPFARIATSWPRTTALLGVGLGAIATVIAVRWVARGPMEYDLWNIRSESPEYESGARRLSSEVDRLVGPQGQEGVAVLVDRIDQVLPLRAVLDARRDAAPEGHRPFDKVVTVFDLLPLDQPEKIALLGEVRDRVDRARRLGMLPDDVSAKASALLSPEAVRPLGVADLPEQLARPFTENDGTRGRLVYIVPAEGRSVWDARYLFEWADSFRETALPDGSVVKGSGRSVIFADLVAAVMHDAPKAIFASAIGTLLVVGLAFRRRALPVLLALGIGLACQIAFLALRGVHLNFLNFLALPITIGVGADYAVNVGHRLESAGRDGVRRAVIETGGAVILCSLTTTFGYLALTTSDNLAIKSFGVAAAAGEVACLLSAVLILPALSVMRSTVR